MQYCLLVSLVLIFFGECGLGTFRRRPGPSRLGISGYKSRARLQTTFNRLGPRKWNLLGIGQQKQGNKRLPPGFALVDGEVLDVSYKVVQRRVQGGTAYFSFNDKQGRYPLYIRPGNEAGWRYVVFQDPYYWRGSGHLILLKKILGVNIDNFQSGYRLLYDAYVLSLRTPMRTYVDGVDPFLKTLLDKRKRAQSRVILNRAGRRRPLKLRLKSGRKKRSTDFNRRGSHTDCLVKRLNVTFLLRRIKHAIVNKTQKIMFNM